MEIKDAPFGLRPVRYINGAPYSGAGNWYWVDASDSTALFIGDPVVGDGTSNTAALSAMGAGTFAAGELQGVTRAAVTADTPILGVVTAVGAVTQDSLRYRAASTERIVFVADSRDLVFEVQGDGALASTAVGLNCNLEFTHDGSTVTALSGAEIDVSEAATTANLQVKILGLSKRLDNQIETAGNIFDVIINRHQLANVTAGI